MSKEIEVHGCADCPFHEYDEDDYSAIIFRWCNAGNERLEYVRDFKTPNFCPLKKEPITVKLKDK